MSAAKVMYIEFLPAPSVHNGTSLVVPAKDELDDSLLMEATLDTSLVDCAKWITGQMGSGKDDQGNAPTIRFLLNDIGSHTVRQHCRQWIDDKALTIGQACCYDKPILFRYGSHTGTIDLSIKGAVSGTVVLESVAMNSAIYNVKVDVAKQLGIKTKNLSRLALDWKGLRLENEGWTLADYGVPSDPRLTLYALVSKDNQVLGIIPLPTIRNLFVKTLTGKTLNLRCVSPSASIVYVKGMIEKLEGIPRKEQNLTFGGKYLHDTHTLDDYRVENESTLHMVLHLRGGRDRSVAFVDVTREDALEQQAWSLEAPKWCIAQPGLSIEGECQTRSCPAYGQMFVDNRGFTNFDLIVDGICYCPMCDCSVPAIKPAFNNCLWRVTAVKKNSNSTFRTPWAHAGDEYTTYNEHVAGMASFSRVQVYVRKLPGARGSSKPPIGQFECPICLEGLEGRSVSEFPGTCGHWFHKQCLTKVKATSDYAFRCPMCRADAP